AGANGEADFGICRTRQRAEEIGRDGGDAMIARAELADEGAQRADDAVDLRRPGIADESDPHDKSATGANSRSRGRSAVSGSRARVSIQRMISRRPSTCSTSAVQLSTQSPSLQ